MKRTKILILVMAVQLSGWVSIAGEPGSRMLQRSAGQVQAAGWTGGAKVGVSPAPRIDPNATSAVSQEKQESLDSIIQLAETVGSSTENQRKAYAFMTRLLKLSPLSDKDSVAIKDVRKDERGMDTIFIRRPPAPNPVEIIFAHGIREDGKLKAHFHIISSPGGLLKVVYKENGSDPVTLAPDKATAAYKEAVKFWKKWEQDYQRNLLMGSGK